MKTYQLIFRIKEAKAHGAKDKDELHQGNIAKLKRYSNFINLSLDDCEQLKQYISGIGSEVKNCTYAERQTKED